PPVADLVYRPLRLRKVHPLGLVGAGTVPEEYAYLPAGRGQRAEGLKQGPGFFQGMQDREYPPDRGSRALDARRRTGRPGGLCIAIRKDRETVRELVGPERFLEVFVDCPLEVCEERDVKGLYKKARDGKIADFTGISAPFEAPENPDVHIRTHETSLEVSLNELIQAVLPKIKL